jgi:hypothetical protein
VNSPEQGDAGRLCTISAGQTFGLGLGAAVHSTIFVSSYLTTWEVGGSRVAYVALALRRMPTWRGLGVVH